MALTITRIGDRHDMGDVNVSFFDVTLDASYPSQGYALTGAMFGFSQNNLVIRLSPGVIPGEAEGATAYVALYDSTQKTLRIYGAQVPTAGSTVYALVEVAAATDLHTYHVNVEVVGY